MTEDAKPGLNFKATDNSDVRDEYEKGVIDDAATNLFEEADLGRLVRLDLDDSGFDDGDFGAFDADSFDGGSLF